MAYDGPLHHEMDRTFDTLAPNVRVKEVLFPRELNPDEPPPEFDPEYTPSHAAISHKTIMKKHIARQRDKNDNARYRNALIEEMGEDRKAFEDALSNSDSPKVRDFLTALGTYKYRNWSMTRIASRFGISASELTQIWREYHLARGMMIVTKAIPRAMERIAQDALAGKTVCPFCEGRTTVIMQETSLDEDEPKRSIVVCPECEGHGVVVKPGHEHSRDKLLEVAGLTKKGGNSNVQINQQFKFSGMESVIEELERTKGDIREQRALADGKTEAITEAIEAEFTAIEKDTE